MKTYNLTLYALSDAILNHVNYSAIVPSTDDDGNGLTAQILVEATTDIQIGVATTFVTFELYKKKCVHKGIVCN